MKPHRILAILVVACFAGGMVWWLRQSAPSQSTNVASAPTTLSGIVAPSASTTVKAPAANNTVTSVATNLGNNLGANGQGAKAKTALGLHFIAEPNGYSEAGLDYLKQQTAANPRLALRVGDVDSLQMMPPLPIYNIRTEGLADIAQGGGLENAQAGDFYYPIESAGKPVMGVEVGKSTANGDFVVTIGGMTGIAAALDQLATNDQVNAGSYEARILSVPNANAEVIWLKSDTGADNDLVYIPGTKADPDGTLYTAADYLKTLLPKAK
jgi:hypothetical protein